MTTIALLGAGFMGDTHATALRKQSDRVRVKVVCSRTTAKAEALAETLGAAASTDLDAVLADPEIDAVDICLPTPLHADVAERALEIGKHVLVEKPIALSLDDADRIARAARRSRRTLMVGLAIRFSAEYREVRRRVRAGDLGAPLALSAHRLSPPADWNTWMGDVERSGGTVVDLMVHDFDQAIELLGAPRAVLARAAGRGSSHDHVVAIVEHDGAVAQVEGSMAMPASYPFSAGIRVLCERGVVEHAFSAAPAADGGNLGATTNSHLRVHTDGATEDVAVDGDDPWTAEIAHFLDCVEQGREPEDGTAAQARAALAVSLAAARSLRSASFEAPNKPRGAGAR